jgi:surface protein
MHDMFNGCVKLTSLDLSGWNTGKLEDTQYMFSGCTGLTSIDISGWNTAKVWYMTGMFANCTRLRTIYAGEGWTTGNVYGEWGEGMFTNCTALVGGMGTAYDENHTDKTYARIDEGPRNPGYFTRRHSSMRGDVNMDGSVTIADVTDLIDILLGSVLTVYDMNAADADRDGKITIADVTVLIDYLLTHQW